MPDTDQNLDLTDYQKRAQYTAEEFDVPDGLEISATIHQIGYPYLEICGRTLSGDKGFGYRAGKPDLQDYGDEWFTKQALNKLSALYASEDLPSTLFNGECEHQYLRPVDPKDPFTN